MLVTRSIKVMMESGCEEVCMRLYVTMCGCIAVLCSLRMWEGVKVKRNRQRKL